MVDFGENSNCIVSKTQTFLHLVWHVYNVKRGHRGVPNRFFSSEDLLAQDLSVLLVLQMSKTFSRMRTSIRPEVAHYTIAWQIVFPKIETTGSPTIELPDGDLFVRCSKNVRATFRQRELVVLAKGALLSTVTVNGSLVCPMFCFSDISCYIEINARWLNAGGLEKTRACRRDMSCIVVDVTTRKMNHWNWSQQTRCHIRHSSLGLGLVNLGYRQWSWTSATIVRWRGQSYFLYAFHRSATIKFH